MALVTLTPSPVVAAVVARTMGSRPSGICGPLAEAPMRAAASEGLVHPVHAAVTIRWILDMNLPWEISQAITLSLQVRQNLLWRAKVLCSRHGG